MSGLVNNLSRILQDVRPELQERLSAEKKTFTDLYRDRKSYRLEDRERLERAKGQMQESMGEAEKRYFGAMLGVIKAHRSSQIREEDLQNADGKEGKGIRETLLFECRAVLAGLPADHDSPQTKELRKARSVYDLTASNMIRFLNKVNIVKPVSYSHEILETATDASNKFLSAKERFAEYFRNRESYEASDKEKLEATSKTMKGELETTSSQYYGTLWDFARTRGWESQFSKEDVQKEGPENKEPRKALKSECRRVLTETSLANDPEGLRILRRARSAYDSSIRGIADSLEETNNGLANRLWERKKKEFAGKLG